MLGRSHRFHGLGSVMPVYRRGRAVRTDGCSLHYVLNPRRKTWRASIVVSKKVSKSAVVRNRIRRRMYEVVRNQPNLDKPYDLVITIYDADLATLPYPQLVSRLENLIQKSGLTRQ